MSLFWLAMEGNRIMGHFGGGALKWLGGYGGGGGGGAVEVKRVAGLWRFKRGRVCLEGMKRKGGNCFLLYVGPT